jgi:hypothetical protein
MQSALERFLSFVTLARQRHVKQMRFALLVAALIALLLWQTQWLTLRPALLLLLIGQLGTSAILFNRRIALSKKLDWDEAGMLTWFVTEEKFVKYLAVFENGVRTLGLMVLAYGFWVSTRNLWLALTLGIFYPVIAYFGMVRGNLSRTIRRLKSQQDEVRQLLRT